MVTKQGLWLVALVAGCVRGGFTGADDAAINDAAINDTTSDVKAAPADVGDRDTGDMDISGSDVCPLPTPALPAVPTAPFGAPVRVTTLNSPASEDDPTLTGDRLEVFFESNRGGALQLWHAKRAKVTDPWPTPTIVEELIGHRANTPEVSRDGLVLRFADEGPGGDEDIFVSTRVDRESPWTEPIREAALSSDAADTGAVSCLDQKGVVFFSRRPGSAGGGDLWFALRQGSACDAWATPQPLQGVNTANGESNPWVREDGLVVAYSASGATGGGDLVLAVRPTLSAPFAPPVALAELNSAANDDDPWLSDDLRVIYFTSPRSANVEIYRASR